MDKFDFSGWATRNDLKCSDGRIIRRDAFKHNDGQQDAGNGTGLDTEVLFDDAGYGNGTDAAVQLCKAKGKEHNADTV